MKHQPISKRRPVNLTLDSDTVAAARELGINLSQTCNRALAAAVKHESEQRWKAENAAWIEAHRQWVDANELPLERYRLF